MSGFIRQHSTTSTFNTSDSWVILNPIEQSIKDKIERIGKPLKEWDVKIYRGILTGCNEAFIINAVKRNEILNNCNNADERKRTDELIRPILRGRDIKRYGYEWANLYLIASHNGIPDKKIPRINIDDYPAVKRHLNLYWSQISKRSDMGDTPYNLRSCAYMGDFSKPKIVYREISDTMNACMVEPGIFINNKCYMLTGEKLGFLLGVLNSTVFNKFLLQAANLTGGKGSEFLEKIYFPTNATLHIEIDELISSEKYNEIDMALGKFYNLTNAENDYLKKLSLFD